MAILYTSYFGKLRQIMANNIVPIGIVRFAPKYFSGINYIALAPNANMLKMSKNEYEYNYDLILKKLNPYEVYNELLSFGNGKDVAILCYEKNILECHRLLVAKWFQKELEYNIQEF